MNINEMSKEISKECLNYSTCDICPLYNRVCNNATDSEIIKENYKLMFPNEKDEDNYAMIDGKKIELDNEMVRMIKNNEINYKEYCIGDITISPNYDEGYAVSNDDSIFIGKIYCGSSSNISISREELPKVIESLTEINNYLQEVE